MIGVIFEKIKEIFKKLISKNEIKMISEKEKEKTNKFREKQIIKEVQLSQTFFDKNTGKEIYEKINSGVWDVYMLDDYELYCLKIYLKDNIKSKKEKLNKLKGS